MSCGNDYGYPFAATTTLVCVLSHFLPEKNSLNRFILKSCAADVYIITLCVRKELFSCTGTVLCVSASPGVTLSLWHFLSGCDPSWRSLPWPRSVERGRVNYKIRECWEAQGGDCCACPRYWAHGAQVLRSQH